MILALIYLLGLYQPTIDVQPHERELVHHCYFDLNLNEPGTNVERWDEPYYPDEDAAHNWFCVVIE